MDLDDELQQRARVLGDPTRFGMLRMIASAPTPIGVAELADEFGFNPNNARQHLAVLLDGGFVEERDEPRVTRGRPRKLYTVRPESLQGLDVGVTPYQRLANLLLELHRSGDGAYEVGYAAGRDGAAPAPADREASMVMLMPRLAAEGCAPEPIDGDTAIRLGVCPFADTAARDQTVVCELHRGVIDGQLRADDAATRIELEVQDPHVAGCIVRLQAGD